MRQAILVEPKHIEFKEVAEPKAADLTAHQVLVNIKRIGICGSEIPSLFCRCWRHRYERHRQILPQQEVGCSRIRPSLKT